MPRLIQTADRSLAPGPYRRGMLCCAVLASAVLLSGCGRLAGQPGSHGNHLSHWPANGNVVEPGFTIVPETDTTPAKVAGTPNPPAAVIRAQQPAPGWVPPSHPSVYPTNPQTQNPITPGSNDSHRFPMQPSGAAVTPTPTNRYAQIPGSPVPGNPVPGNQIFPGPPPATGPIPGGPLPPTGFPQQNGVPPQTILPPPTNPFLSSPQVTDPGIGGNFIQPGTTVPIDVFVEEAQTGRFMFGMGVNSDAGVTGQILYDERNFDIFNWPRRFSDLGNGAFRGGGQGLRIEAVPGDQVQRYLINFTEPYLLNTPVTFNLSGFLYDRRFRDWDEQRLGGRMSLGYRLTPDLSVSAAIRGEQVDIHDPRVVGVPDLDAAVGEHDLFSGRITLTHDTRDVPFMPTEGHFMELSFEQVFGDFDYSRGEVDYRRYFLIRERPDGSGRHTLGLSWQAGFTGDDTPIFENYFAGGYSTLRGFDFRGASPVVGGVQVGGEFRFLGSVEYMFPVTADDMIRGVVFCDYGTVEREIEISADNFRVAPGVGLRIFIPAMGPAPLALDLGFPVVYADTDQKQLFSFFFGFGR